jgi:tetratricopeptide (TPR) repeat protein
MRITTKPAAYGWVAAMLLALGCAGSRVGKIPPGVSPEVAARANAIGANLFVSADRELKAKTFSNLGITHYLIGDSIWAAINAMRRKAEEEASTDSANGLKVAPPTGPAQKGQGTRPPNPELVIDRRMTIMGSYNLIEAQKNLEKSLQLQPFNPQAKNYLALTLKSFAEQFPKEKSYEKSIEIWKELGRLEPGEYIHFYNLGSTAFVAQHWREALANYGKAEELLLASAAVSPAHLQNPFLSIAAALDSAKLLLSIYYQALSAIKLEESGPALYHLRRAQTMACDSIMAGNIEYYLKWINWDAGNIRAAILRDSAAELASQGKFVDAGKIYGALSNEILRTKRAKDDVSWDHASIEYHRLNRRAGAINRLDEAMKTIPKDESDAPVDSSYINYFEKYGAMCHNLALIRCTSTAEWPMAISSALLGSTGAGAAKAMQSWRT